MKFIEAFDLMKIGQKVKRENWGRCILLDKSKGEGNHFIRYENGVEVELSYYNLMAEDWELVEEPKKSLSDKILIHMSTIFKKEEILYASDVKESIREFIESIRFRPNPSNMKDHIEDAKRIFGKQLTKK